MTYDALMASSDPGPSGEALQESALAALNLLRQVQNRADSEPLETLAYSLLVGWHVLTAVLTLAEDLEAEEL